MCENHERVGSFVKEQRNEFWCESQNTRKHCNINIVAQIRVVGAECNREKCVGV